MSKNRFICPEGKMGRVDKVLAESFPEISRSLIQKAIEEGRVSRVDGELLEPKTKLMCGDELMIDLSRPSVQMHAPFEYQLNILYEDDFIIVINKPSGMVTHPGDGTGPNTLVHALMHHLDILCPVGAPDRPGIVHRLDKDTSGVIVVAKTEKAYRNLVSQFSERKVGKEYLALVHGSLSLDSGEFIGPIGRHPKVRVKMCVSANGKKAVTNWKVATRFSNDFTLVSCTILTGRTHQIRVHFSDANHPLAGDSTYGGNRKNQTHVFPRVMLHACKLQLLHPIKGIEMKWEAPIPEDFTELIEKLSEINGDC